MENLLVRKPVDLSGLLEPDVEGLAKQAEEVLGYRAGRKEIESDKALRRVARVFEKLGIQPFDDDAVEAYKRRKERRANKWMFVWLGVALVGMVSIAPFSVMAHMVNGWWGIGGLVGLVALVGGFVTACNVRIHEWSWRELQLYSSPVPEFALQTAIDVSRELGLPHAHEWFVDELRARQRPAADPFLVLRCAGREFYLEVWNEPDFKAKREV